MSHKIANFVTSVVVHFPVAFRDRKGNHDPLREAEWLRSINAALTRFEEPILRKVAQRMIDTRTDRRFPLVAEIIAECERIIAEEAAEKRRSSLPLQDEPRKGNPWSHESQRFADELLHCELGRQAAREGWIGVLWDWIRNHGRMPRQNEVTVDWFRREAEAINAKYNECERGLGGIASKGLAKLGLQVLNRREEKAKLVLGEVEDA
jgi:hypothetical protein